jgi:CheY-like chemotaxis protein
VLVVDDEEVVRSSAQVVLERRGYHVLLAEDGRAAIETFRSRADEIALVLLDMSMPGLSGEQTLQELKAIRPAVRVIVSTGYSEGEAHQRFRGQQLAGFLQKPYTASQLAEKIAQNIPKAGAAGRKLAP